VCAAFSGACSYRVFEEGVGCWAYDLAGLPPRPTGAFWSLNGADPYDDPYLVANPCAAQSAAATWFVCYRF
jgi:hypothetical protein